MKTRELIHHRASAADTLIVTSRGETGAGEAFHHYQIDIPANASAHKPPSTVHIDFQSGPLAEAGANGLTHESLLVILIDRLECFQNGPFACPENREALRYLNLALTTLKARTQARIARGVEGTHTV